MAGAGVAGRQRGRMPDPEAAAETAGFAGPQPVFVRVGHVMEPERDGDLLAAVRFPLLGVLPEPAGHRGPGTMPGPAGSDGEVGDLRAVPPHSDRLADCRRLA